MINDNKDILKFHINVEGKVALRKDNILTFERNPDSKSLNLVTMKNDVRLLKEWTKETGPLPYLSDNRNLKLATFEERQFAQENLPLFASKTAVLVKSGLSNFLYNLMLHLNKPTIPMKSFTSIDKAFIWLKENEEEKI